LNPARGDNLVIHPIRFSTTFMDAMLAQLQAERRQQLIVILVISALALLAAVLAAIWWLRRRRRLQALAGSEEGPLPSLQDLMENPELMGENEIVVLEEQIKAYAMRHPDEVALLINNWLDED
jgi:flagellar biosynthesis/type III secretory pathway M-ring protein FliF/YscJ